MWLSVTAFVLGAPIGPNRISLGKEEVTFSNPEHDFPQRIIYLRQADGTLFARIEGNLRAKPAHEDLSDEAWTVRVGAQVH